MKKMFLTFVAVGFGVSVAFAQVTEGQQGMDDQRTEQQQRDQQAGMHGQDQDDKRRVEMHELPNEVQSAFRESEYSDWQVLGIYEMRDDEDRQAGAGVGMGQDQEMTYAFELAEDEGGQRAMGQDGTAEDGMGGIETERVRDRQPDKIVHFDESGEMVKEKDADEKKDKKKNRDY